MTLQEALKGKVIKEVSLYTNDKDKGCLEIITEDGSKLCMSADVTFCGDEVEGTQLVASLELVVNKRFTS